MLLHHLCHQDQQQYQLLAHGHSGSPSKLIEDRSKLYKQLSELHSLRSTNILTEEEHMIEKDTIMELLKKLKDNASTS